MSTLQDGQVIVLGLGPIARLPTMTGTTLGPVVCWYATPTGCTGGYGCTTVGGGPAGVSVYGGGIPWPLAVKINTLDEYNVPFYMETFDLFWPPFLLVVSDVAAYVGTHLPVSNPILYSRVLQTNFRLTSIVWYS